MTSDEILERFAGVVARSLRIDAAQVTPDVTLTALGAESIDIVEITMEVEHEFGVLMPERSILETAAGVLGEGVVTSDGHVTEIGRQLLASRMPEIDVGMLPNPLPVRRLGEVFTRVDVWLRLIADLADASPRECSTCRVPLRPGSAGRVRCSRCDREYDLPSGDDVNRAWVSRWAHDRGLPSR